MGVSLEGVPPLSRNPSGVTWAKALRLVSGKYGIDLRGHRFYTYGLPVCRAHFALQQERKPVEYQWLLASPACREAETEHAMGAPSTARGERRVARAVAVELSTVEPSGPAEITFTENVSPRGARVLTRQRRRLEERLLLKSREGEFRSQGRVVYCQRLVSDGFAIGLELFTPTEEQRNVR